jgi:hypothetical protein
LWAKVEAKVEVKGGDQDPHVSPGKNTDKTQTKWGKNTPRNKQVKNRFLSGESRIGQDRVGTLKKGPSRGWRGVKTGSFFRG